MAELIPFPIVANPMPWLAEAKAKAERRNLLAREIERLIGILDVIDGDPDLEPDDEDEEHDGREPEEMDIRG
jgi:hypothetical protein